MCQLQGLEQQRPPASFDLALVCHVVLTFSVFVLKNNPWYPVVLCGHHFYLLPAWAQQDAFRFSLNSMNMDTNRGTVGCRMQHTEYFCTVHVDVPCVQVASLRIKS